VRAPATQRGGFGVIGVGAAACVACCAGPVLAFLGGLSIVGAASTFIIGGAGVAVGLVAVLASVLVRRRGHPAPWRADGHPQPVPAPSRRVSS